MSICIYYFFFLNVAATTVNYPLSQNGSLPISWQDALSQAALLLQKKMATESVLIDQIKQLSQKTISPQVDENLGIMDLINNIKGAF